MRSRVAMLAWVVAVVGSAGMQRAWCAERQQHLETRVLATLNVGTWKFKDHNRNGVLDPYEDWRLSARIRADDLLGRMTLDEKAGAMVHPNAVSPDSEVGLSTIGYDFAAIEQALNSSHALTLITRLNVPPQRLAEQNNELQRIGESSRLGIPLSISSDPRHHFQLVAGASATANGFSQWPEPLGLAAIGDARLVEAFADTARHEYRATGIHVALSPQADLPTDPRWPRILGTFGEDPIKARSLVAAYVRGMQHGANGIGADSVVAVVKHWVGYGAAPDGYDAHNYYGRIAEFSRGQLASHITPFEGAFEARVAGIMPTYAVLRGVQIGGRPLEPVAAGYSRQLLTELLRGTYRFDGIIISDWAITMDCNKACTTGEPAQQAADIGTPWGVEHLSKVERFAKTIVAGVDQIGGTAESGFIVQAVREGRLSESRIDESVRRILMLKFQQGLFEDPYVDAKAVETEVGAPEMRAAGLDAQRRALVLLQNNGKLLPLRPAMKKVYLQGIAADVAQARGLTVVESPAQADVAIVRVSAPFQVLHPGFFFGRRQHEGSLDFEVDAADYQRVRTASQSVPTIAVVFLDRPAVLTRLRDATQALIGEFGASDEAIIDVLMGKASPQGRLPFHLPASMDSVDRQASDVPLDLTEPLYPAGWGLRY